MTIQGRITKGIGGFYYVNDAQGNEHECKACGRFRNEHVTPLVGDYVEFDRQNGLEYGFINEILPRKNELTRPAVANIDVMIIVVSAGKPNADLVLCDKLVVQALLQGITPIVCINKTETNENRAMEIKKQYKLYMALCISAHDGTGMVSLKDLIRGQCVCFAGQSAVGKSSIINVVDSTKKLEVGGLSKKTDRGKHTTRTVELFYVSDLDAYILDTPGFSMFEKLDVKKEEMGGYYKEFLPFAQECRFSSCIHDKEPDCMVKQAVAQGKISKDRYERYLKIINNMGGKS